MANELDSKRQSIREELDRLHYEYKVEIPKRIAEARGLDLSRVRGTGPEGRITKEDVEAALASRPAAAATAPTAAFRFALLGNKKVFCISITF